MTTFEGIDAVLAAAFTDLISGGHPSKLQEWQIDRCSHRGQQLLFHIK